MKNKQKRTSFIFGVSGPGRKIICETFNSKINLGKTEAIGLEKKTTSQLIKKEGKKSCEKVR